MTVYVLVVMERHGMRVYSTLEAAKAQAERLNMVDNFTPKLVWETYSSVEERCWSPGCLSAMAILTMAILTKEVLTGGD